jgi:uncharacterized protein
MELELYSAHINTTMQCNLRCKYCFVSHNPSRMTPDTARKAVDWLVAHKTSRQPLRVDFFGGEPTLEWPTITAAVDYGEERYPEQMRFGIVTNCTTLTPERIAYIARHKMIIRASYDGPHTQNKTRKTGAVGSRKQVERTIKALVAAGVRVGGAMTLVPGYTQYLFDNYTAISALGVRDIGINPVVSGYSRGYNEEDWANIDAQYDLLVDWLIEDRRRNNWQPTTACALLERNLHKIKQTAMRQPINRSDYACGACKHSLGIWPDGTIMPCHEMAPAVYPHWRLGSVVTGETFDMERRNSYLKEKYLDCADCGVGNCGHCRVRAFEVTGDEEGDIMDRCRYQRLLYEKAIRLWNGLVQAGADLTKVG